MKLDQSPVLEQSRNSRLVTEPQDEQAKASVLFFQYPHDITTRKAVRLPKEAQTKSLSNYGEGHFHDFYDLRQDSDWKHN